MLGDGNNSCSLYCFEVPSVLIPLLAARFLALGNLTS